MPAQLEAIELIKTEGRQTAVINRGQFFEFVQAVKQSPGEGFRPLNYEDIANAIGITREHLLNALGIRMKPRIREKSTVHIPQTALDALNRLPQEIQSGEVDTMVNFDEGKIDMLKGFTQAIQVEVLKRYSKGLTVKEIERLAQIPSHRLEQFYKNGQNRLQFRSLSRGDVEHLRSLWDLIVSDRLAFTDARNHCGEKETRNDFKLIVSQEVCELIHWLTTYGHVTIAGLSQHLGLKEQKLAQVLSDLERRRTSNKTGECKINHPRLDCEVLLKLAASITDLHGILSDRQQEGTMTELEIPNIKKALQEFEPLKNALDELIRIATLEKQRKYTGNRPDAA